MLCRIFAKILYIALSCINSRLQTFNLNQIIIKLVDPIYKALLRIWPSVCTKLFIPLIVGYLHDD
jgi:uncharacterized protein YggT (Ycf19 family)